MAAMQPLRAEAELTAPAGEATGPWKVHLPLTFGLQHLAPLWAQCMAPKVRLDLVLSDRIVDLVEEGSTSEYESQSCRPRHSSVVSSRLHG